MGQRSDDLTGGPGGYSEQKPFYVHGQQAPASDDEIVDNEERIRTPQSMSSETADNAEDAADSVSAHIGIEDENPPEIRDDIEDTRARMSSTIDAIQEKLSPQT